MIKGKLYTPQTNLEMLKVHKISKSQAWQRTGRAGRESDGICYRIFTEDEYNSMPLNTIPEILRSNLSSVALQLIALGINDIINFDFMSKPSNECLEAALNDLELLGAIRKQILETNAPSENGIQTNKKQKLTNTNYELTDIGKKMSQFPLDPKLSRCILAAESLNCVEDILKIVSVLSVENIFHHNLSNLTNNNKRDQAQIIRQKFSSADGDHISLLNVFKAFSANKHSKEWCLENMLDFKNLKLSVEICKQLREICSRSHVNISLTNSTSRTQDTVNIRRSLIAGFFLNAAEYQKENEYKTVRFFILNSS